MSLLFLLSVAYAVLLVHNHPTSLGKRERQGDTPCTPAEEVPCTPFSSHLRWFCTSYSLIGTQRDVKRRISGGCGSFFCKDSFLGSATQRPPPRMIGRWTAGTTRRCCRSGRRRAGQLRGGFSHRTWSRRCAPEPQRQQALQGLFSARLGALASLLLATLLPLPPGSLPRLVPTSIADGIAQR